MSAIVVCSRIFLFRKMYAGFQLPGKSETGSDDQSRSDRIGTEAPAFCFDAENEFVTRDISARFAKPQNPAKHFVNI
jgi:hypothetical protein